MQETESKEVVYPSDILAEFLIGEKRSGQSRCAGRNDERLAIISVRAWRGDQKDRRTSSVVRTWGPKVTGAFWIPFAVLFRLKVIIWLAAGS